MSDRRRAKDENEGRSNVRSDTRTSCLVLALVALLAAPERAWAGQRDALESSADVIARVNGEPITRVEHRRMRDNPLTRRQLQDERGVDGVTPEELDRLALRKLIHLRLLLQEAHRRGITVTEKELDAAIASLRRRFEDLASFGAWMKAQSLDEESLFESVRNDMAARRVAAVLAGSARVGEDEVRRKKAFDAWLAAQEAKSNIELVSEPATVHAARGN